MKTIHGRYYPRSKKIEIFNLSRPTEHIITTTIHEVAHHIDFCLRHNSDHSFDFYKIMYSLLEKAIGMGIISKNDIMSATDSADKERLERYFGDINTWQIAPIKYKQDIVTIKVKNSFTIKDILKKNGYNYSPIEQIWEKNIDINKLEKEINFLKSLTKMENIIIDKGNQINIQAVYYISVFFADKYKDYLKSNGYIYNGFNLKNKAWNKKISAKDLDNEMSKIQSLEGIKIKVKGIKKKKKP